MSYLWTQLFNYKGIQPIKKGLIDGLLILDEVAFDIID